MKHISVLVVIFRTKLGHTTQIRYNLLDMLAFLYQKEIFEIKAWMNLIDSMVDDNVDDQLQRLQIPCHRFCSFLEPLMHDTQDLMVLTQTSNSGNFHPAPQNYPLHLLQMGAAWLYTDVDSQRVNVCQQSSLNFLWAFPWWFLSL